MPSRLLDPTLRRSQRSACWPRVQWFYRCFQRPGLKVVPEEGDLAVAGYDSLAAFTGGPAGGYFDHQDLAMILAYEQAHRNRQTIVHRVRQLLEN